MYRENGYEFERKCSAFYHCHSNEKLELSWRGFNKRKPLYTDMYFFLKILTTFDFNSVFYVQVSIFCPICYIQ